MICYNFQLFKLRKLVINRYLIRNLCEKVAADKKVISAKYEKRNHTNSLNRYFKSSEHLEKIKQYVPLKYFQNRKISAIENLYLVDSEIAKLVVKLILPHIKNDMLICESSAGLGLITSELLEHKVQVVRIYEPCPEFRTGLKEFSHLYPGQVELFVKDIFQLSKMSYMDKLDRGNRVKQMTKGIHKKNWEDSPVMTIIGATTKVTFLCYLMRILAMQTELITNGRLQLFCFMRPSDYIKLTAGPHLNLHTYQMWSVLFSLFFDCNFLEKIPRKAFLPWEQCEKISSYTRYFKRIDIDSLYLVRINFKNNFPVENHELLPLYFFVRQFFGRGSTKIIPSIEKLIPGLGANFIIPKENHNFPNIGIYSKFGSLNPDQIMILFKEMIAYNGYKNSSFASLVEAELLKSETVEIDPDTLDLNPDIIHDLEDKIT